MPRRRRSRRYAMRPLKTAKYSNETFAFTGSRGYLDGATTGIVVTKATDVLGTRKCKNFTLSIFAGSADPFLFALVFVPEGTVPSGLSYGNQVDPQTQLLVSAALYNPNQNVIMQGMINGLSGVNRIKTRLARNLNSNDKLILLIRPTTQFEDNVQFSGTLNYAISY